MFKRRLHIRKFGFVTAFNKITFIALMGLLACSVAKVPMHKSGTITLTSYVQKEIPGEQGQKIKKYLNCSTTGEEIQWDSLSYASKTYWVNQLANQIKVELESNVKEPIPVSVVVYYKTEGQNFKIIVDEVLQKEDLYLP